MSNDKLNKIAYTSLFGFALALILFLHLSDEVWILSIFIATVFTIFGIIGFYKDNPNNEKGNLKQIVKIYISGLISIFFIRFLILLIAGLMISVPTKNFIDGSQRNITSLNYHKYMEYENSPEYYENTKQLFIFYHFNDEISNEKHEQLTEFLIKNHVFLFASFVNIETKEGLALAEKFDLKNGHTIVLKYEDRSYYKIDMSEKEFLNDEKLLEFIK